MNNNSVNPQKSYLKIAQQVESLLLAIIKRIYVVSDTKSIETTPSIQQSAKPKYFRPPGALNEDEFVKVCLRCRKCTGVCSTDSIRPLSILKGLSVAWTPVIKVDSGGYCIRCLKCTKVCPSGALQKKSRFDIKIGEASIDETKCYDWTKGEYACSKCINTCPLVNEGTIAIKLIDGKPAVQVDQCMGCAVCAMRCPAKAIKITLPKKG